MRGQGLARQHLGHYVRGQCLARQHWGHYTHWGLLEWHRLGSGQLLLSLVVVRRLSFRWRVKYWCWAWTLKVRDKVKALQRSKYVAVRKSINMLFTPFHLLIVLGKRICTQSSVCLVLVLWAHYVDRIKHVVKDIWSNKSSLLLTVVVLLTCCVTLRPCMALASCTCTSFSVCTLCTRDSRSPCKVWLIIDYITKVYWYKVFFKFLYILIY